MSDKGQNKSVRHLQDADGRSELDTFLLNKGIFSNIFEKDIRHVYIYKKAERLAKAIHLIAPAFKSSPALRERLDQVSVRLIDAAILPPTMARDQLPRELLALSSFLSIARSSGLLSSMNAELVAREAHLLLEEVATYDEPRIFLEDAPTFAQLAKSMTSHAPHKAHERNVQLSANTSPAYERTSITKAVSGAHLDKGHESIRQVSDKLSSRREAILSILKAKGPSYIKDISTIIRDVSEKTIQRELQLLVERGEVSRTGERRWTTYSLAAS